MKREDMAHIFANNILLEELEDGPTAAYISDDNENFSVLFYMDDGMYVAKIDEAFEKTYRFTKDELLKYKKP